MCPENKFSVCYLLDDEEVKTVVVNQMMSGGLMCATEPLDKISDDRLMEYRRILPVVPGIVRPIAFMEGGRFPGMSDVYLEKEDAHLLCVINWEDEKELIPEICIQELLPEFVAEHENFVVCDYYAGEYFTDVNAKERLQMKPIAPHGANVYKVVKQKNKPLVVKSNGHYSMGGEIEFLAWEGEKLQYCIKNAFDVPLDYEILLPNKQVISLQIPKGRREIL